LRLQIGRGLGAALLLLFAITGARGQTGGAPTATPAPAAPSANQAAPAASGPTAEASAQVQATLENLQKRLQDWPNLARYHDADEKVPPPGPTENRVVFMGDSITDNWGSKYGKFFPGEPYINRGISGQTTPQMLIRFWPDVVALGPKVVVILAGTNDIAGNTGPTTLEAIEDNLMAMTQLARSSGIRVVLASLLPVTDAISPQTTRRPPEKIVELNQWIRDFATQNGMVYLDYYSALIDDQKMFRKELTVDGLHPNDAGYEVMGPLAEKAIAQALQ
jgi:lysophospholipase L1-like esterase